MDSTLRRTWAEIDLDALEDNYRALRAHMGPYARFLGVVKADSYGHGAVQIGRTLEELGAEYLAVSNIDEARELRRGGIRLPILQLGIPPADQTAVMLVNQVTQAVYSEESARAFSARAVEQGAKLCVHIKLDTGMSRLGFPCDEDHFDQSLGAICRVCALPGLEVEGIFTHFAVADEPGEENRAFTILQHDRFLRMLRALREAGISFDLCHCANSGATVNYPQFAHDMFRPGILTYGVGHLAQQMGLRPLLTLKTTVGAIREYLPGTTISYGRTYTTTRNTRVGVLPIGYADGLPWVLSDRWQVWTAQGPAPITGRICMDMCMVDLTDLPQVQEGDEVEVYGPHNTVTQAADLAGVIPYELTCAVSRRVPRAYFRRGREIARELLLRG